jgi:hypothetical protein
MDPKQEIDALLAKLASAQQTLQALENELNELQVDESVIKHIDERLMVKNKLQQELGYYRVIIFLCLFCGVLYVILLFFCSKSLYSKMMEEKRNLNENNVTHEFVLSNFNEFFNVVSRTCDLKAIEKLHDVTKVVILMFDNAAGDLFENPKILQIINTYKDGK